MICKKCGSQIDDGSKFCGLCGSKVEVEPVNVQEEGIMVDNTLNVVGENASAVNDNVVSENMSVANDNVVSDNISVANNNVVSENPSTFNDSVNNVSNAIDNGSDGNISYEGSHKSGKKIVIIVVLLLIISLLLGGVYFYLNSTKRIVSGLVNSLYEGVENVYSGNGYDITKDSFLLTGDLSIDTNVEELSLLNGEKFGYILGLDYPNKKLEVGASLNENNFEVINGHLYVLSDSSYISIKDVFDGLINLNSYGFDKIFSLDMSKSNYNQDDVKYVVKAYKDILIESLDMDDFKKSNDTIIVDGKDVKVKRLSYELNDERFKSLVSKMCDGILNDSKLLDILSKGSSIDSIKYSLEQSKSNNTNYLNGRSVRFDIYTKGFNNEFVGMDIEDVIQIRKNGDSLNINIGIVSQSINIVINKASENSYSVSISGNIDGKTAKVDLIFSSNKIDDKTSNGSISLSANYDGKNFRMTNNYTASIGSEISDVDVSSAKSINNMSEEELDDIGQKVISKFTDSNLYGFIEEYLSVFRNTRYQSNLYSDDLYDDSYDDLDMDLYITE